VGVEVHGDAEDKGDGPVLRTSVVVSGQSAALTVVV
jgi:hypothetical protein